MGGTLPLFGLNYSVGWMENAKAFAARSALPPHTFHDFL